MTPSVPTLRSSGLGAGNMRMSTNLIIGLVVVLLGFIAYGSLFTVNETQQAIVMQFGEPKRVITEPGLAWKLPLLQNVQYYERSEEHTSELQSLMRITYDVFCLKKKKQDNQQ